MSELDELVDSLDVKVRLYSGAPPEQAIAPAVSGEGYTQSEIASAPGQAEEWSNATLHILRDNTLGRRLRALPRPRPPLRPIERAIPPCTCR